MCPAGSDHHANHLEFPKSTHTEATEVVEAVLGTSVVITEAMEGDREVPSMEVTEATREREVSD